MQCGILQPEKPVGSLRIVLVTEQTSDKLKKTQEALSQVQCVVKKGSETKFNGSLTKQGTSFHGDIRGLEPGTNYTVLLYGKNISNEIIGRGYKAGISVTVGETTAVTITWIKLRPTLSTPANGATISNNTPSFDWNDVSGISAYELIVDNSNSFDSPEINQANLLSSSYAATSPLTAGTYYWKVRCKDSEGNWGGWSEVFSFTITLNYTLQITISPSSGGSVTKNPDKPSYTFGEEVTLTATANTGYSFIRWEGDASGTNAMIKVAVNSNKNVTAVFATGIVTDIDGNTYLTMKIGNQTWMAENLKVTHYRNGDAINNVTDATEWINLTTGAYCNYDNNTSNVGTYGRLYNWYAVNDNRNISPEDWHVPTDEDWKEMEMHLGMSQSEADAYEWRGTDEGGKLKETGINHWNSPNTGATNESGFTALPGGFRHGYDGHFSSMGSNADFWSFTEGGSSNSWGRGLYYSSSSVARNYYYKPYGFSVRCVKDEYPYTPPIASFNVTPLSGNTNTQFSFDATGCSDNEDDISQLQVRWDWENDGTWDTEYSTTKTAVHQFNSPDTYTVLLGVKDTSGLTGHTTKEVTVYEAPETGSVTDIDGNVYQTVKIGNQWWMMENLKVTSYRNGEAIPNVTDTTEWYNLTTGAYCYYDNDAYNTTIYGRLYNWYSINDSRSIAPTGWHVPTDEEWTTVINYLGGESVAGGKLKENGTTHWTSPNNGATNESGFSALPGGYRHFRM